MHAIQIGPFDYGSLDTETRIVVQQRTTEIRERMDHIRRSTAEIGQRLRDVKTRLGHGEFGVWLATEFQWSQATAENLMSVATLVEQNRKFYEFEDQFARSALYLLAAPSTPESARQDAVERAAAGERISHHVACGIVTTHKDPPIPFVPATEDDTDEDTTAELRPSYEETYVAPIPAPHPARPTLPSAPPRATPFAIPPIAAVSPAVQTAPTPTPSLAVHQLLTSSESNEWYTPAEYVTAARMVMGGIDLDPASNALANQTVQATRFYTQADDGFTQPWGDIQHPLRLWLNPPYGKEGNESNAARWARRLITAYEAGQVAEAVLLVNASTGDGWFTPLKHFPICFPDARIRFYSPNGDASQPTHSNALVYLGPHIARFVEVFSRFGAVMARLSAYDGHVFVEGLDE